MSNTPLPEGIITMLRGAASYSAEWEDVATLAQEYYQEGKTGQSYEIVPPPVELFPADIVEILDNFLRRCWEQGKRDAGKGAQ